MKKRPNWPAYVQESNGRVVYRPRLAEAPKGFGIDSKGRLKPPIRLGKITDSDEKILQEYLKALQILGGAEEKNSLKIISEQYKKSQRFVELSPTTQDMYANCLDLLLAFPMTINREEKCFGDLQPSHLNLPMLNRFKDKLYSLQKNSGHDGISRVNGQFRVLRAMLSWAQNNIEGLGVAVNPVKGIQLGREKPRERYVTDEEYMLQYHYAVEHCAPYLPLVFEHAYLLACRSIEVCKLELSNICPEGYLVKRTKNSKDNLIRWSPRLEAARDAALAYREKVGAKDNILIPSLRGAKLTKNTLQSAMQILKKMMQKDDTDVNMWNLHDLKRKGISDADDARIGGHKSDHIRERYMVKLNAYNPPR